MKHDAIGEITATFHELETRIEPDFVRFDIGSVFGTFLDLSTQTSSVKTTMEIAGSSISAKKRWAKGD